jgi:hypothetical protein
MFGTDQIVGGLQMVKLDVREVAVRLPDEADEGDAAADELTASEERGDGAKPEEVEA